jgi:hypothetical protein
MDSGFGSPSDKSKSDSGLPLKIPLPHTTLRGQKFKFSKKNSYLNKFAFFSPHRPFLLNNRRGRMIHPKSTFFGHWGIFCAQKRTRRLENAVSAALVFPEKNLTGSV